MATKSRSSRRGDASGAGRGREWFGAALVALLAVSFWVGQRTDRLVPRGGSGGSDGATSAIGRFLGSPRTVAVLALGTLLLAAGLWLSRRLPATSWRLPLIHAVPLPHDESRPHAHALTSLVLFGDDTVTKIYAPGLLPRALYRLAFQAPFPYEANQAALEAAVRRRNLAGRLTEYWYGERRVARALAVDRVDGRLALTSELIAGVPPEDSAAARRFLHDLSDRFDAAGLPTWQVDPRQPRSLGNILQRPDGAFVVIDLESGLVSPLASPRAWWRALRRGLVPIFDDVYFDLTRAYVEREAPAIRAALGDRWLAGLRAALAGAEEAAGDWHDGEPRIWGRIARGLWTGFGVRGWPRRVRARLQHGRSYADTWLNEAIETWHREGRVSAAEAERLRAEASDPQFQAVLPHLGVHLMIGVALRFPFGAITRAAYTLGALLAATARWLTGRIDRGQWRRARSLHSPLVLFAACVPGFGTFAYLTSKPVRSHGQLARVLGDATLRKLPWHLYARSGLADLVPSPVADPSGGFVGPAARSPIVLPALSPGKAIGPLVVVTGALFAIDLVAQAVDDLVGPRILGWSELVRITDLNSEASLGTWFSVVGLAACALLLALIAHAARQRSDRFARHWLGLSAILLGLSVDEQAKVHDLGIGAKVREYISLPGPLYFGWVLVALVSLVVVWWLYRRFVMALPAAVRLLFLLAGAVYVAGEVGVEMVSGWYAVHTGRRDTLTYATITSIEELLGMLGISIALCGLLVALERSTAGRLRTGDAAEASRTPRVKIPDAEGGEPSQRIPAPKPQTTSPRPAHRGNAAPVVPFR